MVSSVIDVSTADFATTVLQTSHQVPVVVDLWAEWCGPCKTLGPVLERAAEAAGGEWILAKLDVDSNPEIAQQLGVQGIPTVVAFKDGVEVDRFTGAVPEPQVLEFVGKLAPSQLDRATAQADAALDSGDEALAREIYETVLQEDSTHQDAGLSLAGMMLEDGDRDGAIAVLERLAQTEDVKTLMAYARLGEASGGDLEELASAAESGVSADRLVYGRALAGAGQHEQAIDSLMALVGERAEPESDEARASLIDLFDLLGTDNPLVQTTRRRLANGLF